MTRQWGRACSSWRTPAVIPCDKPALCVYIASEHAGAGRTKASALVAKWMSSMPAGSGSVAATCRHHGCQLLPGRHRAPTRAPEVGLITEFHCSKVEEKRKAPPIVTWGSLGSSDAWVIHILLLASQHRRQGAQAAGNARCAAPDWQVQQNRVACYMRRHAWHGVRAGTGAPSARRPPSALLAWPSSSSSTRSLRPSRSTGPGTYSAICVARRAGGGRAQHGHRAGHSSARRSTALWAQDGPRP